MDADPTPRIQWELSKLAKLGLVEDGEVLCDAAEVFMNERPGALFITNRKVVYLRTTVFLRRTQRIALTLNEVASVEAFDDPIWEGRWGALRITATSGKHLEFTGVPSGRQRAEELANSIIRQRNGLPTPRTGPN